MNLPAELTRQIAAHLDDVRKHLENLPADERQEILQSIESHIYDALESRSNGEPTPALLAAVLAEMDPPESYGELSVIPKNNHRWLILALLCAVLVATLVMYFGKKESIANNPTPHIDPPKAFLKPVGKPSTPTPPPGKYAFQIIKVTAPAEIIQSPQEDIEKIIQKPGVKIGEYPLLIAGLGESVTNEQIDAMSMDIDWGIVDGKPVTEEKTFRLGDSISVIANKIENGTISYHLNIHHLELNGFFDHKIENGFIVKKQPRFKKEAVDTHLAQKLNSWMMINGIVEPQPDGKNINQMTCIRVTSSNAIQNARQSEPIGRWVSVDFVESIEQFNPQIRTWRGDLYLKELTFLPDGKTDRLYWTWKDGVLHHSGDNTDAKFLIKQISGEEYLFLEWMSGDVTDKGLPPKYYVLKATDRN